MWGTLPQAALSPAAASCLHCCLHQPTRALHRGSPGAEGDTPRCHSPGELGPGGSGLHQTGLQKSIYRTLFFLRARQL